MRIRRTVLSIAAVAASALVLAACSDPTDTSSTSESSTDSSSSGGGAITVGSADFPESTIIGNIYAEALRDAGIEVETSFNIGAREAYLTALTDGSIDLIPDYTGNLLLFLDENADVSTPETIEEALPEVLAEEGLTMLTPASAEDKDSIAVTAETAKEWDLTTIGDLAAYNDQLKIGGPPEFSERAVGLPGLKANYGVDPVDYVAIADGGGPATVQALIDGQIQAANIFSTSTSILENDFVVLEDPKNNFPSQKVVPVLNTDAVTDEITEVLNAVSEKLTTDELITLNDEVSGDSKTEPKDAAVAWLTDQGLI